MNGILLSGKSTCVRRILKTMTFQDMNRLHSNIISNIYIPLPIHQIKPIDYQYIVNILPMEITNVTSYIDYLGLLWIPFAKDTVYLYLKRIRPYVVTDSIVHRPYAVRTPTLLSIQNTMFMTIDDECIGVI